MSDKKTHLGYACKQATHTITVRSVMRGYRDTKSFSIHCKEEPLDELKTITENKISTEQEPEGELAQTIDYVDEAYKSTHQISITDCEDKKMRSFRIQAPDFSSYDIALTLSLYLTGEDLE